jgi:hypothetical protein
MERNHDNITFINDIIQSQEPFLRLSDITADTNENMLTPPWPHAHPEDIHINNIIGVQYQPDNEEEVNNSIGGPTSYVNLAGTTVYIPCQKSGHFNGSLEHCNFCKLEAGELDHLRPYQRDRLTIEAPHNPPDWFRTRKFSPEMCEHHPDLADDCYFCYEERGLLGTLPPFIVNQMQRRHGIAHTPTHTTTTTITTTTQSQSNNEMSD